MRVPAGAVRWLRGLVVACLSVVLVGTLAPSPAWALNVSAEREALWSAYKAAGAQYNAAWSEYKPLVLTDRKRVGDRITAGSNALKKVKPLIEAARTTYSVNKAKTAMAREGTRAKNTRYGIKLLREAMDARALAATTVQSHLAQYRSGTLSAASYRASAATAAAVSTRVEADRKQALALMASETRPGTTYPLSAAKSYAAGSRSISSAAGWTGVPGGCALPKVTASTWLGRATDAGPRLWTHPDWEKSARDLLGEDAAFDVAYDRVMRFAANEAAKSYDWGKTLPSSVLPKRSLLLGARWRELGDTSVRSTLLQDVQQIVVKGPTGSELQSAMTLEALATSIDLTEPSSATLDPIAEQLVVKWLGPASCQIADRSTNVDGSYNIPVIHNTAHTFGAVVVADQYPDLAAALIAASLNRVRPALTTLTRDGGTPEGPEYWGYQGRYAAALYATVASLYGTNPPIALPDPSRTVKYWHDSTAPNGQIFTHGDSDDIRLRPYLPGWVGFRTGNSAGGAALVQGANPSAEAWSLWWWPRGSYATPAKRSTLFSSTGKSTLHTAGVTAWLKGGRNSTPHSQFDLGTVSYARHGVLWAVDPYKGPYGSAYFSPSTRGSFWEASTRSHSTLRVWGQENQWSGASAPFTFFSESKNKAKANLRSALPGTSTGARTVSLYASGSMNVNDVATSKKAQQYVWQWTTDASASVSGQTVTLTRSGKTVRISFSGLPSGSRISVVSAPSGKKSVHGLPLRQIQVVTGKTKSLSMTANVR